MIGRANAEQAAICSGVPSRPGPSSSTKRRLRSSQDRQDHAMRAPVSSALSANSLRTRRRSRLSETPAFLQPSTDRNSAQSWRSAIFKFGCFSSASELGSEPTRRDRFLKTLLIASSGGPLFSPHGAHRARDACQSRLARTVMPMRCRGELRDDRTVAALEDAAAGALADAVELAPFAERQTAVVQQRRERRPQVVPDADGCGHGPSSCAFAAWHVRALHAVSAPARLREGTWLNLNDGNRPRKSQTPCIIEVWSLAGRLWCQLGCRSRPVRLTVLRNPQDRARPS